MSWKRKWMTLLFLSIIWLIAYGIHYIPEILHKNYSSQFHLFFLIFGLILGILSMVYCYYKLKQIEE
ncbi:MAG: hypothetical protein FE045_06180 [Thermoplasmata archaeon]|nr:MAG: hypothetical protein FE045_06180 [Thermoplasmata archaeon]